MRSELTSLIASICPPDMRSAAHARTRWNSIAKPLGGMGMLEDAVCTLAAIQKTDHPCITRRALAVFCADNGIVAEGVTQTDAAVTAVVAKNLCVGETTVCHMAQSAHCDVFPVDMGMRTVVEHPRMTDMHVGRGTQNFLHEDAMTRMQAEQAIIFGAQFAEQLVAQGYQLLAIGEMGIGNTTTSSAIASVLLQTDPAQVTGAGAGLSAAGVAHKIAVIREGIARRQPRQDDAVDVLQKLGGFDIAGMVGFLLGSAARQTPVLIDGVITQVAALVATHLCPAAREYMLASHTSAEKASGMLLRALNLSAPIAAHLHVGEGTGCMALLPLLDMALAVYEHMPTFADMQIPAYTPLQ